MGGCRVALAVAVLALAIPLLSMGTASAVSFTGRGIPARPAFHPPALSGVVTVGLPPPRALADNTNVMTIPFGTQYRVTNDPAPQNEVSIAVNPANPMNIVASANDWRGGSDAWCGVYATANNGQTWTEQLIPATGGLAFLQAAGDPSVAFDADGNAYQACLGFNRTGAPGNVIAVSKSTDGGFTWGTPVQVAGTTTQVFHDKPYIAVDRSSGPTRGNVYVTWTRFRTDASGNYIESPIYFVRSVDGGATWSPERDITSAGWKYDQGSQPDVGPAGELYVTWVASAVGGNRIVVAKSTDAGTTWGPTTVVSLMFSPGELYPMGQPRTPHFPSIAVNPIDAPGGNRVHVVWADTRFGDADIVMSTSENGGVTWGTARRVNDDASGNAQFFPWVTASAKGLVHVSFYDRRDDPSDRLLTVYVATSTDFGLTFGRNRRASAQFDPGDWFIGDYNGIASYGDFAYPAWCDLRNGGEEEVYMAGPWLSVTVPPIRNLLP